MAIAVAGSVSRQDSSGGLQEISGTLTFSSGANRVLVVSGGGLGAGFGTVSLNGTLITKVIAGTSSNIHESTWFYNNPPASSAGTILARLTAFVGNNFGFVAEELTGVAQTGNPAGSVMGTAASGTTVNGTLTTSTDNSYIVGGVNFAGTVISELASGQVRIIRNTISSASAASYLPVTTAGAGTMSWGISASVASAWTLISLNPVVSGAGTNLIQSTGTANLGVGATSASWAGNTTTGNLIVVGVTLTNAAVLGTVTSITDSQSNTYLKAISGTLSSGADVLNGELWYALSITGGAGSVTVNHTIDNCAMFAREYSGFNTLDVTSSATGSSTTPNSGTSSVTAFGTELIVVSTADDKGATQTWTAAGNYADMVGTATTITGQSMEDNIVTATGAQTGTLTLGSAANWTALLASFYQAAAVSSAAGYRNLLGVGL